MFGVKSLAFVSAAMTLLAFPACKKSDSKNETPKSGNTDASAQTQKSSATFINMNGLAVTQYVFAVKNNDGSAIKITNITIDGKNPKSLQGFENALVEFGTLTPTVIQAILALRQSDVRSATRTPLNPSMASEKESWEKMNGAAYVRIQGYKNNIFAKGKEPVIEVTTESGSGTQKIIVPKIQDL